MKPPIKQNEFSQESNKNDIVLLTLIICNFRVWKWRNNLQIQSTNNKSKKHFVEHEQKKIGTGGAPWGPPKFFYRSTYQQNKINPSESINFRQRFVDHVLFYRTTDTIRTPLLWT